MTKITILISTKFIEEKKYILDVFFRQFLAVPYVLNIRDGSDYQIILPNSARLIIKDSFFDKITENNYLHKKNIPEKVLFAKNSFIIESDIPVLFGNENIEITEKEIQCNIDIFSSTFFMLTRWEEFVLTQRDIHNRFPLKSSLAYKFNFLNRPIVNEYLEFLWNMLMFLGYEKKRKEQKYQVFLTHDIDFIRKWNTPLSFFKTLGGDILVRKNIKLALNTIKKYSLSKFKIKNDPFDTYDFLMDCAERINKQAYFYFMSGGITNYDNNYKIKNHFVQKIIKNIEKRGHKIGIHPSYNSYNNLTQWQKEYNTLNTITKENITEGRQHFLNFEIPVTWQIWDDNNMQTDSSLLYAEAPGFRGGTCYDFEVFNILTRKQLNLKERPITIMETTLFDYLKVSNSDEILKQINYYYKIIKKYSGNFVLLWHNSTFYHQSFDLKNIYLTVLNGINST